MSLVGIRKVGYEELPICLMFSGWLHSFADEQIFLGELAKHYWIHLIDLPGYANQADAHEMYGFEEVAGELHEIIRKNGLEKVPLLGFSMGCRLLISYVDKYSHKGSLIFIGCPPDMRDLPWWGRLFVFNRKIVSFLRRLRLWKAFVVRYALRRITNDSKAVFTASTTTLQGAFDSLMALLWSATTWNVYRNRATYIYGSEDTYLTEAQELKPDRLVAIPGIGHNCFLGHEKEIVELVAAKG